MGWRSGQSYSQDLRDRVLGAVDGGIAVRAAAATFGVSIAYIYKALMRRRLTGDAGINPNRGHNPRKFSTVQEQSLAAHMRSRPGITLAQAQAWLLAEHGVQLSTGATWSTPSVEAALRGGLATGLKSALESELRSGRWARSRYFQGPSGGGDGAMQSVIRS
jgi:transposase